MTKEQIELVRTALDAYYAAYASKGKRKLNADYQAMARIQEAREAFDALVSHRFAVRSAR